MTCTTVHCFWEIEGISMNCQLHFTRAIVRTLVERLELANTRVAQR